MSENIELPHGWISVHLQDICQTTSGGTPSRKNPEYYIGDIPWIKSGELNNNLISSADEYISELAVKNSSAKIFPKGTLLIALYGATIGKLAILGIDAATNQAVCGIFESKAIDTKYLSNYLFHIRRKLIEKGAGGAQPNISQAIVKAIALPLPPLSEQHRIVSKIEELFSSLDKGVESLKLAQQQLKVYRQAVLKWAFEGKLTNKNVKHGELPEGWKVKPIGKILQIINNGYTPSKEHLTADSGEVPFIKVYNLDFSGTLNFSKNPTFIPNKIHKKDLKRSICNPGDVLINIVGPPLGKVSIVPMRFPEWNINQAIVMFRPNEQLTSKYLAYFMQNHVTIQWLEGTSKATAGQWNVKVSTCREIPITLPKNIIEQEAIVSEIESRLSVCDKIEESIEQSLQQAEALRQSILKKAFEGKLVPQDRNDESASVLLERIRAENQKAVKSEKVKKAKKSQQTELVFEAV